MRAAGKFRTAVSLALLLCPALAFAGNSTQHTLTDGDLAGMAGNPYNSGELPLGDGHYVTDGPKKGYIYLCRVMEGDRAGAQVAGSWIHNNTWNSNSKLAVQGQVSWSNAQFANQPSGTMRELSGNGLPVNHTTGIFPIQRGDPVYYYDRNPNSISPQTLHDSLPLDPSYSDAPNCMGGEVGIMLTGVPLFNGFDAGMRDAPAHEVQDSCDGHPQKSGEYHYHSLSACIKDIGEKTVIGYALDGFPITGPLVAPGRYLVTANLDECHGITSEIIEDGHKKVTYHYVMTQDFPYSVSCFRGTPVRIGPSDGGPRKAQGPQGTQQNMPVNTQQNMQQMPPQQGGPMGNGAMGGGQNGMPPQPPGEAVAACEGRSAGSQCGFATRRGDMITGRCLTPPGQSAAACVPVR